MNNLEATTKMGVTSLRLFCPTCLVDCNIHTEHINKNVAYYSALGEFDDGSTQAVCPKCGLTAKVTFRADTYMLKKDLLQAMKFAESERAKELMSSIYKSATGNDLFSLNRP